MHKLLLPILLLFYTYTLTAQEIVNPSKLWSSMEEHCQPWGSTYSTDYLKFDADTLIGDIIYKRVWISEDENHENWNFYGAFIREENNRVYYRQMFEEEGLIYDFNLEIGDSVLIDNPRAVSEIWLLLSDIDSVETTDGMRERWKLTSNDYPNTEYWIRGIGSQTGVLNSSSGIFGGLCGLYTLLCQKENGELVYLNPEFESCFLYTTGRDEYEEVFSTLIVSYNHYTQLVDVRIDGEAEKSIYLSNLTGQTVSHQITFSETASLPTYNSPSGIYIVTVILDGSNYSKKILIP